MLESFLSRSVPDDDPAWALAVRATREAATRGAPFRPSHEDKATLYAWLAWQEPPGRQLHDAVKFRILASEFDAGRAFAEWFRRLVAVSD